MSIVTIDEIRDQLGMTAGVAEEDNAMLLRMDSAALNHIERLLGFKILSQFGGEGQEPVPEALREAVLQLVAFWYENREAASDAARELPFGVREIVLEYREFTF